MRDNLNWPNALGSRVLNQCGKCELSNPDDLYMNLPICSVEVNYQVDSIADDSARFLSACDWVASEFSLERLEVSIAIVDDTSMHALNRQHLDHDWPTDVISFVFEHDGAKVDGEIIASAETARRVCRAAGWSAEDELLLYIVHGLLHLAGMNDLEQADQAAMREAERRCLIELGVVGAQAHIVRWDDTN